MLNRIGADGVLCVQVLTLGLACHCLAAQDVWTPKADMPTARYLLAACEVDGKIYAIGGALSHHVETATVYAYDPATDTWARKADAPTARAWLSAGVLYGRIYTVGGVFAVNGTMYLAGADSGPPGVSVEEYDPAADTWTIRAGLPTPRGGLSAAALSDKIYALGGMRTFWDPFATVEEYDPYPLVVDFNGDGMLMGGPLWQPDSGIAGGALLLDGVDDYVETRNLKTARRNAPAACTSAPPALPSPRCSSPV